MQWRHDPTAEYDFVGRLAELNWLRDFLLEYPRSEGVAVIGPTGVGKTALVRRFAEQHRSDFPGGIRFLVARDVIHARAADVTPDPADGQCLIVVDEADAVGAAELTGFVEDLRNQRNAKAILIAGRQLRVDNLAYLSVGTMSKAEVAELGRKFRLSSDTVNAVVQLSEGAPLVAHLLAGYAGEGHLGEMIEGLGEKPVATVLGADGKPLSSSDVNLHRVEVAAGGINDALIAALARDPELLYTVSYRKFEELVAHLYEREGYEVELTPVSGDEGVDIYAVQRTSFGSFLTVVDCKRYRRDRPVEVGLIRQLFGTVEAKDASVGVLATTSYFTKGAKAFQEERRFRLGLQDFLSIHQLLLRDG
jgi:restriction endonuclease